MSSNPPIEYDLDGNDLYGPPCLNPPSPNPDDLSTVSIQEEVAGPKTTTTTTTNTSFPGTRIIAISTLLAEPSQEETQQAVEAAAAAIRNSLSSVPVNQGVSPPSSHGPSPSASPITTACKKKRGKQDDSAARIVFDMLPISEKEVFCKRKNLTPIADGKEEVLYNFQTTDPDKHCPTGVLDWTVGGNCHVSKNMNALGHSLQCYLLQKERVSKE